jgi:hypothetical protein
MTQKLTIHHARIARPAPSFTIPEEDQGEFQRLPKEVRDDVDTLLIEFEQVFASHRVNPVIAKIAARLDFRRGFTYSTLRWKYYTYINGGRKGAVGHGLIRKFGPGDWRILVDYARCSYEQRFEEHEHGIFLPREFTEYLKGLFQSNQRKSEPAVRLLYRLWRAGESIPGYGTWQEWFMDNHPHHPLPTNADGRHECPPELPRGWSKTNLARYIPERAELALARRGIAAARQHLPSVIMTREGLRPLEIVLFDDVRTDFKILVPGHAAPVELNLLVALDLATGMILRFGLRPAVPREDTDGDSARDKLKLRDMKTLIAGILTTYGVPKNYTTTYVVENATAAIKEGTALALAELSCQRIQVSRTMMINGTAIWGGYKDKPTGNARGKAALESTFNLLHNEAAFLPGQTGRRYDAGPADLHGRTEETKALTRVANKFLTPHQRASLKLPFLSRDQARLVLADIFNQIIRRTDHEMENFQPLGEWREKDFDPWRPESELLGAPNPAEAGEGGSTLQWRNPPRRESPLERWERLMEQAGGAAAFTKLHTGAVMRLYDEHAARKIIDSEIIFKINRELFVYRTANVQHAIRPLANGAKVLCYFDREDMNWLHVTDGSGGYLGSIPRTRGARRTDKAALQEQFDSQRKALHDLQAKVSARMPQVADAHLTALETNTALLAAAANAEAVNIAPENAADILPAPEMAIEIATRTRDEKSRLKTAASRSRALKNFRGEVEDLVGEQGREGKTGQGETSNIEHRTLNTEVNCGKFEALDKPAMVGRPALAGCAPSHETDRECEMFDEGRENRAGESRERENGNQESEQTSPRNSNFHRTTHPKLSRSDLFVESKASNRRSPVGAAYSDDRSAEQLL